MAAAVDQKVAVNQTRETQNPGIVVPVVEGVAAAAAAAAAPAHLSRPSTSPSSRPKTSRWS